MAIRYDEIELSNVNYHGNPRLNSPGTTVRVQTEHGYVDVGPGNSSWSHFSTDRAAFYFNTSLHSAGVFSSYSGDLDLQRAGTSKITAGTNNIYIKEGIRIQENWGQGDYSAEQLSIVGSYASMSFRDSQHDHKWLIHHNSSDALQFYEGDTWNNNTWSPRASFLKGSSGFAAHRFVDIENGSYYVEPASTSNLNGLTVNGTFTVVNGTINMNNNDGFVYDDGANVMKVKYDGTTYNIWTQANDGSGSGLDADLLDGLQASQFLRSDTSDTMSGALTVLHDTFGAGIVSHRNHSGNAASITFKNNSGQAGILYATYADTTLRWRDGVTTNGYEIWHEGNDGSGSGLDADKLDGKQPPTNFSATSQTYTTISSGGWALPTGSSVFSKSNSAGGVGDDGYWFVLGRRDTGGGYSGIYAPHSNGTAWLGMSLTNSANPTWYKLWTDANDGSGSGLDADNLDGFTWMDSGKNVRGDYVYVGSGGGFFYNDTSSRIRTNYDFYTNNGNTYLYANNLYLGATSGDNVHVRGNYISGNNWEIDTAGKAQFSGALKITETGTAQHILIGNQDSGGVNKPAMIMGVNGHIRIGYGNSWSGEGGTFTSQLTFGNGTATFNSTNIYVPNIYVDNAIHHNGDTNTYIQFHTNDQFRVVTGGGERLEVNSTNTTLQTNLVMQDHDIRGNGSQLVLNAGESAAYYTGQTGEIVYINAEGGLQVNSSPDNWSSGWAGRKTATINNTAGDSYFPNSITVNGHFYGKSVNGTFSNLYRMGGVYFTWDSDSYGTNFNHSITSTYGGNYGDHITLNSFGHVRINVDSNGNGNNTFSIGRHTTGTANTMLTLNESMELTVNGDVRSPIFYDSNNTARYVNPASTSIMAGSRNHGHVSLESSHGRGFRFWNSNSYKISMSGSTQSTNGGRVAGETTSDYNMYFTMSSGTNRGFVFKKANSSSTSNCVAGIDASGNGRFIGDLIAYSSSDKRLKDNITPIENPIDKVQKISGVTFDWNDKQDTYEHGKHDVGVIAQEIEEVLPEVVDTRENGYKAVKYEKIVPLLIEAIKEQQKQIDELKSLINK